MQHRQESNDWVNKQDVDMIKDDKEKQDPVEEKGGVTASRNRETEDDDRDSHRQRLSSVATHDSKPQRADVKGGDLGAGDVQKARQLEVECLN